MAVFGEVRGIAQAKATFKRLPEDVRVRLFDEATEPTARAVLGDAKRRLRPGHGYRTGELQRALDVALSPKTGIAKVGIVKRTIWIHRAGSGKAFAYRPSKVGHLIEFGHGGPHAAKAYPFLLPAAEGQRQPYAQRAKRAIKGVETNLAARGGRVL